MCPFESSKNKPTFPFFSYSSTLIIECSCYWKHAPDKESAAASTACHASFPWNQWFSVITRRLRTAEYFICCMCCLISPLLLCEAQHFAPCCKTSPLSSSPFVKCQQGWFCPLLLTSSSSVTSVSASRLPLPSSPPSHSSLLSLVDPDRPSPPRKAEFLGSHGGRQQVAPVLAAGRRGAPHGAAGVCVRDVG